MDRLLEVNNLKVSYHTYAGEVQSVRGVSFYLNREETLAIVGESGCGKSVTARSIMQLIAKPGEIKAGSEILFDGQDILKFDKTQLTQYRGGKCSMIFQDALTSLNPTMMIGKQISENIRVHRKISKKAAMAEAIEMLHLVGMPNPKKRSEQYPHEFSGGMRQRAMIAIALACNPEMLIADEPTTALDVTIQAQILDLISDLQKRMHSAVVLITHDLGVVAGRADRIAVMYCGKIVEHGKCRDIFYEPKHPYTKALLASIPRLDLANKQTLSLIEGTPPDLIAPPKGCPFSTRCKYCMRICRERMPGQTDFGNDHSTLCWLYDSRAPQLEFNTLSGGERT